MNPNMLKQTISFLHKTQITIIINNSTNNEKKLGQCAIKPIESCPLFMENEEIFLQNRVKICKNIF